MAPFDLALSVALGVALAAATGFRVFLPMLIAGAAAYTGHLPLSENFAWLGTPLALTMLAVAALVEIVAYYVPGVDHLLDAVAAPEALVAGTVVSAAVMTDVPPMVSLYRSQHELFPLYKKGSAPHINNIELGKNGRWRSNVWNYPGASSVSSDSRKGLVRHPTVKPEAICVDAILDLTNRGDIVLDPFLGSGSTLIAAQRTGRRCFGIELDPLYVDVIIDRFRQVYGRTAILESTGETFEALAKRRLEENGAG